MIVWQEEHVSKSLRAVSEIGSSFMLRNSQRAEEGVLPVVGHDALPGIAQVAWNRIDTSKARDPASGSD